MAQLAVMPPGVAISSAGVVVGLIVRSVVST
jgi:hypothetical protein